MKNAINPKEMIGKIWRDDEYEQVLYCFNVKLNNSGYYIFYFKRLSGRFSGQIFDIEMDSYIGILDDLESKEWIEVKPD